MQASRGEGMSGPVARALACALAPWLEPARVPGRILLAVSGGPDSTALMHAVAEARAEVPVEVATVDHGLRPESAAEARAVAEAAARLGFPHHHLRWDGPRPATSLPAAARAARYRLLAACAAGIGARCVLTAHTRDDQAETVLMRLIAGSGPGGLAGMRPERALGEGVILARPFLGIPKIDLIAWCEARGLPFASDPSNADEAFARARLRRLLPRLAREGLSTERLVRLADRAARDEAALRAAAERACADVVGRKTRECLHLDGAAFAALPEAVAIRVADLVLDQAGGEGPRRLERLERLILDALLPALRAGTPLRRTLRGLLIEAGRDRLVTVRRAPRRRGGGLAAPDPPGASRDTPLGELLGKGGPATYIGAECADGPAASGKGPGA
ncbi:tRNA lysidine(34) synthetase TilS [Methylobacterium nigriterrae]|uniref:tRNA lysidine(34) synthetase TilS n=1 Tax=Methylobacterium nigriterrae TaxID=3127512 RepID=UPI003013513F